MTDINDPIEKFHIWYQEALIREPEADAMALATCSHGIPTVRMVLLKKLDAQGFIFFTHSDSVKGKQLQDNPHAACCFYWQQIAKQVRVEGTVTLINTEESDDYFHSRARESQISALTSKQSQGLSNYPDLLQEFTENCQRFESTVTIPRPTHWQGYCIKPLRIEFWQAGEHRLHHRELYEWVDNAWDYKGLLYP